MKKYTIPSVDADALVMILGLGQTGVAAAQWCHRQGARLRVVDTRDKPAGLSALRGRLDGQTFEVITGENALAEEMLAGVKTIVISPGLSPLTEPVKTFLAHAQQRNIEVIGEIELFARALEGLAVQGYRPKVAAVTGTNGKTTVTAMIRQLVQSGGFSVRAAGNIGPAALDALLEAFDSDSLPEVWVLELSSFQLVTTRSLHPDVGVVLNVSQDHLDWHGSLDAYVAAKATVLSQANVAVVNRDDPLVTAMVDDVAASHVRSFGSDVPRWVGDLGLQTTQSMTWLTMSEAGDFDFPPASRKQRDKSSARRIAGETARLMPADALRVRGRHNGLNALAALAVVRCLNVSWADALHALRDYGGEPDRTEFVRTIGGVDFVNDSKGTNVGATVAALDGLEQKVVLIAGGVGKGQDFSSLAVAVAAHARAVLLIGQDAALIAAALNGTGVPIELFSTLEEAVTRSATLAQPGETVLLSPACASLDMFDDYRHRGQAFIQAVQAVAAENGEVA